MIVGIACFVAGLCASGFIALWFSTAYKELSETRRNLDGLWEVLQLHKETSVRAAEGLEQEVARDMLSTNRRIFHDGAANYNRMLKKPMNRIPALLLGFRPVDTGEFEERS